MELGKSHSRVLQFTRYLLTLGIKGRLVNDQQLRRKIDLCCVINLNEKFTYNIREIEKAESFILDFCPVFQPISECVNV